MATRYTFEVQLTEKMYKFKSVYLILNLCVFEKAYSAVRVFVCEAIHAFL